MDSNICILQQMDEKTPNHSPQPQQRRQHRELWMLKMFRRHVISVSLSSYSYNNNNNKNAINTKRMRLNVPKPDWEFHDNCHCLTDYDIQFSRTKSINGVLFNCLVSRCFLCVSVLSIKTFRLLVRCLSLYAYDVRVWLWLWMWLLLGTETPNTSTSRQLHHVINFFSSLLCLSPFTSPVITDTHSVLRMWHKFVQHNLRVRIRSFHCDNTY